ncbi:MAG: ABC transporter ATP-binding protein [Candidatus Theseobacter exili]|nr:ABC transporter ATP-binding protein [Candidatus Theseobacter exili]
MVDMPDIAIKTDKLTKIYKNFLSRKSIVAIKDLDIQVQTGEIFGLLGPNGSGKTTTLKAILGLVHPTKGSVRVFSKDPRSMDVKSKIGFLTEESYLYRFLNADETLHFVGRLAGIKKKKRVERIEEVLGQVGLLDARKRRSKEYSKGMARRLSLAQVLLKDPELIVLDEPTLGLDPVCSREIKELIIGLKKRGKTIVLSSHLLSEIENICDRLLILNNGVVIKAGNADELLEMKTKYQFVFDSATPEMNKAIKEAITNKGGKIVFEGHPKKNLDDFFLETIGKK